MKDHYKACKKAMFSGSRSWISLILGLVILATGILPLLNMLGIIGFNLSFLPLTIIEIVIVIGGIWLIIDGIQEFNNILRLTSIISGSLIAIIAGVSLLNTFGVLTFNLTFIPATLRLLIQTVVGILLLLGAFIL